MTTLLAPEDSAERRSLRVLVADDEPDISDTVRDIVNFHNGDHVVTVVADGRAAITALYEGDFDLVITDWDMPEADGMAVLRAATDRSVPRRILHSGSAPDAVRDALTHHFGDRDQGIHFLRKPSGAKQILALLNT